MSDHDQQHHDPAVEAREHVEQADRAVENTTRAVRFVNDPGATMLQALNVPGAEPHAPEMPGLEHTHQVLGGLHAGMNLANAAQDVGRGDGVSALQHGSDGAGQLISLIGDATHNAPLTNGGNALSSIAALTGDARDIHEHGANGQNVNDIVRDGISTGGAVAALAGVPGANAVAGAYGVGNQIGTAVHNAANVHARTTGEYGVDHVTQRGVNVPPSAVVNRDVDDDAAIQGGRTMMNDIHNGHGDLYANTHGALVAMGTGIANTAHSAAGAAMDSANGFNADRAAQMEQIFGAHVYRPSELANMIDLTDPAAAQAFFRAHPDAPRRQ